MKRVSLKMKDVRLFETPDQMTGKNRISPGNEFIEFKKGDIRQSISSRFEQQVRIYPDKVAIKVDDQHLTYQELDIRSNRVAHAVLRQYDDSCRLNNAEKTRYQRQMILHGWGIAAQEKLKNTTVFVAGAGGSGSPLIMQLGLAGFGTIIICDFDEVELSNLNRQFLHDDSRIGMNKALSAAQTLQRINPHVRAIAYSQKITRDNIQHLAAGSSIIFDNVDDIEAKFILSQYAVQQGIPHILSSMIDMNAYAAIFHTPHTPCYHCLYDRDVLKQLAEMKHLMKDYQKNPNPVASPALFMSTGFVVNEAIKIVLGFDKEKPAYNKFFLFNQRGVEHIVDSGGYQQLIYPFSPHFRELSRQQGFDWEKGWQGRFLEEIEVRRDPHCPACGKYKREELQPLPAPGNSTQVEPIADFTPASAKDSNTTTLPTAALLFGRDADMVIGILGALKAGKAYVPLDPGYPRQRLMYMLEDAEARVIITNNANYPLAIRLKEQVNQNSAIVNIDELETEKAECKENPGITIEPEDLAYILYTSGSTGQPKGVMQNHRNVLHFSRVYTNALHLNSSDRLTLFSSYGFDAAKMDIYGALLNGGTLYPYDIKQSGGLTRLAHWLEAEGITVYHSIPTVYRYFTDSLTGAESFKHLRFIVLGGEAVLKKDVESYKKYFPGNCLFVNGLGPTESTVTLQYFIDKNMEISKEAVPVGYPVAETEVLLLDEHDRETEGYGIGEIVYKSDYLALGYLHNREKTEAAFVKNPLTGKDRVYRSGDLGRRLHDGSIEYMGRKDDQVKVRGYRVELQEIEGKLDTMPGIKKSAVICKQDDMGEGYLIAYYVQPEGKPIDEMSLADGLKEFLPDYMVPGAFYRLPEFSLTATGKIDRSALARLAESQSRSLEEYVEPGPGIQQTLAGIWKQVLKVEKIGAHDNFFVLGGNSLKAILLTSLLHKELDARVSLVEVFRNPTISRLAGLIEKTAKETFTSIEKVEEKEYYRISSAQKRLYVLQKFEPASISYNMLTVLQLKGSLDREKLEFCFQRLIQRHESLRTSFPIINEEPVQRIHRENDKLTIINSNYRQVPDAEITGILHSFIRPFDLSRGPLIRVGLIKEEETRHILLVDMHHIIGDGTSNALLAREFMNLYAGNHPAPLRLQYRDYSLWQGTEKEKGTQKKQEEWWLNEFSGEISVLQLPLDYPRPGLQDFAGAHETFTLEAEELKILTQMALEQGTSATLYMVILSLYSILLAKLSGQVEVVIGTPTAGRTHPDLEPVIGVFVNTLAMRTYPVGEKPFKEFLTEIKEKTITAFANQEYPFEELVERVSVNRDMGRNPLFDTAFLLQNLEMPSLEIPGMMLEPYDYENKTSKFDLTLQAYEAKAVNGSSILVCFLEYCTRLFKPETIRRFIDYFKRILAAVIGRPGIKIAEIEIISGLERQKILEDFNATSAGYPSGKTLHELFAEQVERTPDKIALIGPAGIKYRDPGPQQTDQTNISYRQLHGESDGLAGLLNARGVHADNIVGIMPERSVGMIIGILAILKAGGAYLPIDPDYPEERIHFMLRDSGAEILLNEKDFMPEAFKNYPEGTFPSRSRSPVPVTCAAYIIYTSGTTGKPKGVIISHNNVVRLMKNDRFYFDFNDSDIWTLFHSFCFDFSVWEMYGALLYGGKLIIIPKIAARDTGTYLEILKKQNVTVLNQTPSAFYALSRLELKTVNIGLRIRWIIFGGEALDPRKLKEWKQKYPQTRLVNMYGITETTVHVTYKEITECEIDSGISNIGHPIPTLNVSVINRQGNLQPISLCGECCVTGHGLARGYLNRPELTNKKFFRGGPGGAVFSKKVPPGRRRQTRYHSGDLVRWLSNGDLEYLGRIDQQVKIRGFRVELGEIENRILNITGIKEALVSVHEQTPEDRYLCAYFVSAGEYEITELREHLASELPEYMIPSYFVRLEKFPLNANGKIDRRALPLPGMKTGGKVAAPGTEIEKKLVRLWSEVLARDTLHASQLQTAIGIHDNFFHLGGHSLKATILAAKIHKEFDVKVPLADIFKTPRIKELAKYIKKYITGKKKELHISIEPAEEKEYYELSPAQKRLYILQQLVADNTGYNMPYVIPLAENLEKEKLESVFKRLINRHESLRTSFITVNRETVQKIHRDLEFSIGTYEIEEEAGAGSLISRFVKPFNLQTAPLLRVNLVTVKSSRRVLFIDMHHIITDGTSQGILEKEFRAVQDGGELRLLRLQYKDYSQWYNRVLRQEAIGRQESFWMKIFPGEIPVLNLPADYPRPLIQGVEGNVVGFSLAHEDTGMAKRIAAENHSTLYMFLLAVLNVLLSKLSGQEDIIIGTPIAARRHADLQEVIGMLVNTLAMRNYPSGDKSFAEFLNEVNRRTLDAYENQEYPFEVLVDKIKINRDTSRNPVFDVMFNLLNQADYQGDIPGQHEQESTYRHVKATSKFDLNLTAVEIGETLYFTLEYSTRLFRPGTIERIINYYKNILKVLTQDTGIKISEIEIMDLVEQEAVLRLSRGAKEEIEETKPLHRWFEEQAEKTPDNIAVTGQSLRMRYKPFAAGTSAPSAPVIQLSYRKLNEISRQLACRLSEKGVGPGSIVGLMVERSLEMITGLLGILKTGAAYLPIDSQYPGERKTYMIADGQIRCLLTSEAIEDISHEMLLPLEIINPAQEEIYSKSHTGPEHSGSGSDLLYVIYTSGSTGKPKGVMLEQRNLVNLILYQYKYTNIDFNRVLQFTTISFDVSAQEIFSTFLSGGQLFLVNNETRTDIPGLFALLEKHRIKTVFLPVSLLKMIFNEDDYLNLIPRCIAHITTAGEQVVISENFRTYLREKKVYLHNHYGPSESHVVTAMTLDPEADIPELPPIGKPVMNTAIYIVDKGGKLSSHGIAGEILIGGMQVGRGYLNRPELTNEKFQITTYKFQTNSKIQNTNYKYMTSLSYLLYFSKKIYKTGDLARWLPDGNIEFLGRIDHQVKIRGFRVELGEIENRLLNHDKIKEAAVIIKTRGNSNESEDKYICAYIVPARVGETSPNSVELRKYLEKKLPNYMIPDYFIPLDQVPLTPSGKIDRNALLSLKETGLETPATYIPPASALEKIIAQTWKDVLQSSEPGIEVNFFDIGGNSLRIMKVHHQLKKELNMDIPVVKLFEYPTIRTLALYLEQAGAVSVYDRKENMISPVNKITPGKEITRSKDRLTERTNTRALSAGLEIAVIGMAGIFPGAKDLREFWENLKNGVESIAFFNHKELEERGVSSTLLENPDYVKARAMLEGVEYFDAEFFNYTRREAQVMDPQVRIFHQCVWHALEDAGYDPFAYPGRIGLYAGSSSNIHWEALTLITSRNYSLGRFQAKLLMDKDFLCTHISYKLSLKGPSFSVQTACSTSLTAIHLAVQALLDGECEMALAGGITIDFPGGNGYIYQEGMIHSPDGHCRSFDAASAGIIEGNGAGAVLLKPLHQATADRDHIYAIIKGTAINNDGDRKVGYTAPSVAGQVEVIQAALYMAGIEPADISYVETHGTATELGDPVEIEALKMVFNKNKEKQVHQDQGKEHTFPHIRKSCGIGSLKTNVGHMDCASGVGSFIKTVLALQHRLIPPSLHFETPNPKLGLEESPFYVVTGLTPWKGNGKPLRAGVSSLGIGGTNAHVILEETPRQILEHSSLGIEENRKDKKYQLLLLSAKTPAALDKMTGNLVHYFKNNLLNNDNHENPPLSPLSSPTLADAAYTLQVGRKHFPYKRAVPCASLEEAVELLEKNASRVQSFISQEKKPPVVFVLTGQGSQYVGMGLDLYRSQPLIRQEMDQCFELVKPLLDLDLKEILYPLEFSGKAGNADINRVDIAQPILFAFEYALAKLLMQWGIQPRAMIGYSLGEFVAACLAGVFSLEDAIKLVTHRARLIQEKTPEGVMLTVSLPEQQLKPLLNQDVSIANVNGPSCIVAGTPEAIAAFETEMKKKLLLCTRLNIPRTSHSTLVNCIRQEFETRVKEVKINPPQIPYISNVTGNWITAGQVTDPAYWGEHLCSPVRFSDGIGELLKEEPPVFVEIGPGRILSSIIQQQTRTTQSKIHENEKDRNKADKNNNNDQPMIVSLVRHQHEKAADDYFLLFKIAQLWAYNVEIDWNEFHDGQERYRLSLPVYPFQGKRYWRDEGIFKQVIGQQSLTGLEQPDDTSQNRDDSLPEDVSPSPAAAPKHNAENYQAPRNKLEQEIARLWQNLLGTEKIGIYDDFFHLNGDSLTAMQLITRIKELYPVEIAVKDFFDEPTIAHLSQMVKKSLIEKVKNLSPEAKERLAGK